MHRERLEGGGRGDVDHGAAPALDHRRAGSATGGRAAPRSSPRPSPSWRSRLSCTSPTPPKPALLTRISTSSPSSAIRRGKPARARRRPEVGGDRLGADAVQLLELVGERPQPVLAPRHQEHAVPARGELARELLADAARGAGDRGPSSGLRGSGAPSARGAYPPPRRRIGVIESTCMEGSEAFGGSSATRTSFASASASSRSRCRAPSGSRGRTTRSSWRST